MVFWERQKGMKSVVDLFFTFRSNRSTDWNNILAFGFFQSVVGYFPAAKILFLF